MNDTEKIQWFERRLTCLNFLESEVITLRNDFRNLLTIVNDRISDKRERGRFIISAVLAYLSTCETEKTITDLKRQLISQIQETIETKHRVISWIEETEL